MAQDLPVFDATDCGQTGRQQGRRTTSNLNEANNDTGRIAFCGPYVISAVTGWSISKVEDEIRRYRDIPDEQKPLVRGTYTDEVEGALASFGYSMVPKTSFMHLARKERPSVWTWMQKPRNAWAYYILAIHKGKEGHWILIKGVKMCDTFTAGKWTFVCDGPHRGARIMEIFEVRKALDFPSVTAGVEVTPERSSGERCGG